MKKLLLCSLLASSMSLAVYAKDIIPVGNESNKFYYKIGGGSDFAMPPVSDITTVNLNSNTHFGLGARCNAYNPGLTMSNSINDLKSSAENLEQSVVASATGALVQLPMYFLAQANPTAYNLLNNALNSSHKKIEVSTKSCETIKDQISNGKNPYQDWGVIAVGDQWKKRLTVSPSNTDINQTKKDIEAHSGEEGVTWVQGNKSDDGSLRAGGKSQPPVHVIADTVKAGYNTMLNRNLQSEDDTVNSDMSRYFANPRRAVDWITSVVGDQVITTCQDENCKKAQGSVVGHGLLPWVTSCKTDKENCADTIRDRLAKLVSSTDTMTKENLMAVSADGIVISPEVIASIRSMDSAQQMMIINKLSQEVAVQRVIDKALVAKDILSAGSQVPAISANQPAQVIISRAITNLDNNIRSLAFSSQVRKQTMSSTIYEVLNYGNQQRQNAVGVSPVSSPAPLMENGAFQKEKI